MAIAMVEVENQSRKPREKEWPIPARRHASDVMDSAQQLLAEAAAVGLTAH
ncbi:hypothetical protein AB0O68_35010 [Streptomyces sp. NPDC087512]|uniref:hypothetical protein n=1 Tax=Streptomyces sp. NPDC087512 TaxID=3155059 RepID=UPI00344A73AA